MINLTVINRVTSGQYKLSGVTSSIINLSTYSIPYNRSILPFIYQFWSFTLQKI